MSRRLVSAVAVSVLLSLTLVVGCSSSDSSEGKEAGAKTTTSEAGSGKTTTTKAGDEPTDTTEADGGTETTAGGGGGGGIELKGDFCEKARQLEGASDQIFGETSTDTSPDQLSLSPGVVARWNSARLRRILSPKGRMTGALSGEASVPVTSNHSGRPSAAISALPLRLSDRADRSK